MQKFYRVRKDTFMWKKGAILTLDTTYGSKGGYEAISDLWDNCELGDEYISATIIESKENADYFERVYDTKILGKVKYLTKEAAQKLYDEQYK